VSPGPRVRALIVDDEPLARRRLAALLADEPDLEVVGEADGGSSAVQAIVARRPDLVFLDVQMPGLDGFGVLRCTAGAHRPVVVFVTAHDEHAIRAFEINAADYLLKPVNAARLHQAVGRAVERVRAAGQSERARAIEALLARAPENPASAARIPVRGEGTVELIRAADVLWVEADRDHLRLHLSGGPRVIRETLTELAAKLEPHGFVRVHRSALVNRALVRRVDSIAKGDYYLVLSDGTRVRTGRSYRGAAQRLMS
jgi:two-component system, LytTR family, response regulator